MACATAIALLMICVSLQMVSSCPAECSCSGTEVICDSRQFTSVPQNISANTTVLFLNYNYITELDSDDFNELVSLRTLSIYRNKLATIPEGVFNELRQLEVLSLNDNEITALDSGVFSGLVSLQTLTIYGNKLTTLPEGIFIELVSLQTLSIYRNKLATITEGVFNELRQLELLSLYDNEITALDSGVFSGLVSLQTLTIWNNKLTTLPEGIFIELVSLRTLSIYGNELATIPEGVFNELRQLEVLYLNSNEITALNSGAFNGLVSLQRLVLYGNKLTCLSEGVFNELRLLEILYLFASTTTVINPGVFDGLVNLQTLYMDRNELTTLPGGVFDQLQSLEVLRLFDNDITSLDSGVFDGLVSLRILDIYGNKLTSLSEGVFNELRLLSHLFLYDNDITLINPGVFDGLVNLKVLRLFDNDITSLDSGVFDELVSLRTLRIDGNNLTTLPEGALGEVTPPGYSIALSDNPWNCDCKLRWLQKLLLTTDVTNGVDYPTVCKTPSFHASVLLVDIQPEDLVCPPEIQTDREEINLDVTSGIWVELVCPVIGDPIPFITWRVSYGAGNSSQMNISSPDMTHSNGSLTIGTVMESDSGSYTCIASNLAGSDQLLYHVNVIQDHKQATDTPRPKTPNLTLPISLGVLGLFLIIIATLIFIVIKQRAQLRKQDGNTVGNTGGIQGYYDFITSQPEIQLNIVAKNEDENDHYNTIDEDGARIDAQPEHIHAQIKSNSRSESGAVYETRIHNGGQF